MSNIKFLTDSAADIPPHHQTALGIQVLPFMIAMGDRELRDCVDFTPREFYAMLDSAEKIPTHSQITAFTFEELYRQAYSEGYTDLIYTAINAKGSATYQNAVMAREQFFQENPDAGETFHIYVLDSHQYTYAYGYAVVEGAKLARQGKCAEEVVAFMQDWMDHTRILFAPYSLKFAKKSGRVSAAAAFLGEALGLKPIMSFPDGESKVLAKVRGDKAVIPAMMKIMAEEVEPGSPYLCISGSMEEHNEALVSAAKALMGYDCAERFCVGGVIAINAGHNLTGIIYRMKD